MSYVPRWTLVSSVSAPVLLIGGWTVAGALQGPGYDPVNQTISILASVGAAGYWVMTGVLVAIGGCYLTTARGLRAAALAGRVALGGGGVAAIMLTLFPAPSSGGSLRHGAVVAVGFTLLALWPVLAADRRGEAPWGLRLPPAIAVCTLMWIGGAWFLDTLLHHGAAGLAERVLTLVQALWPLVVVASCLRHPRTRRS